MSITITEEQIEELVQAESIEMTDSEITDLSTTLEPELFVSDLGWEDFVRKDVVAPFMSISTVDGQQNDPSKTLLKFVEGDSFRLEIAPSDALMPFISDATVTCNLKTKTGKNLPGFMMKFVKENGNGMFLFVSISKNRKIVASFKMIDDLECIYNISVLPLNNPMSNLILPPTLDMRDTSELLTDVDRVFLATASLKISKESDAWQDVKTAIKEINKLLCTTIDPNYINKIFRINRNLMFPVQIGNATPDSANDAPVTEEVTEEVNETPEEEAPEA